MKFSGGSIIHEAWRFPASRPLAGGRQIKSMSLWYSALPHYYGCSSHVMGGSNPMRDRTRMHGGGGGGPPYTEIQLRAQYPCPRRAKRSGSDVPLRRKMARHSSRKRSVSHHVKSKLRCVCVLCACVKILYHSLITCDLLALFSNFKQTTT